MSPLLKLVMILSKINFFVLHSSMVGNPLISFCF